MAQLIDGKKIAAQIKEEVKSRVELLHRQGREVCLAVVQVGEDPASSVYVRNKQKACEYVGMKSVLKKLPEDSKEEELLAIIKKMNQDREIHGILVQLPLPEHIDENRVIQSICPDKDVDGFHPENAGRLCVGAKGIVPCTPAGIINLLRYSKIEIEGKECVVVGRSNIVGKPLALLLLGENGTVTVAHSHTHHLKDITKRADILIVAIGRPSFITADYVKTGAAVIDVGIHRRKDGSLCGDVDFASVKEKAAYLTPVPGGVGPMTIAMLMHNCVLAAEQ